MRARDRCRSALRSCSWRDGQPQLLVELGVAQGGGHEAHDAPERLVVGVVEVVGERGGGATSTPSRSPCAVNGATRTWSPGRRAASGSHDSAHPPPLTPARAIAAACVASTGIGPASRRRDRATQLELTADRAATPSAASAAHAGRTVSTRWRSVSSSRGRPGQPATELLEQLAPGTFAPVHGVARPPPDPSGERAQQQAGDEDGHEAARTASAASLDGRPPTASTIAANSVRTRPPCVDVASTRSAIAASGVAQTHPAPHRHRDDGSDHRRDRGDDDHRGQPLRPAGEHVGEHGHPRRGDDHRDAQAAIPAPRFIRPSAGSLARRGRCSVTGRAASGGHQRQHAGGGRR
jgi:hypothetical protein